MDWEASTVEVGGVTIGAGENKLVPLHLARLFDYTELTMTVRVIRGSHPGPTMFVSAAVHGDEIIGTEVIKRLLAKKSLRKLRGTLILIPIVNVFGFNHRSRYFPDRRDLNRCFPGSREGSLASRTAYLFVKEILKKCDIGIDLHSASNHRTNLPQIRACMDDKETEELAKSFGAPVILDSKLRDGSLREAAREVGVKSLLFEGGEGLRYDESVIKVALKGIMSVMAKVGMLDVKTEGTSPTSAYIANSSHWLRAPQSGGARIYKTLGARVKAGDRLAVVSDAFGENAETVRAREEGVIIGLNRLPLVNKGDALFHIATFAESKTIDNLTDDYSDLIDGFY